MYSSIRKNIKKWMLLLLAEVILVMSGFASCLVQAESGFSLTAEEQAYTEEKGTLTVAILNDWKPFSNKEKGENAWQGLIVDILERFGNEAGIAIEYKEAANYLKAASLVESGEADLMAAVDYPTAKNPYDTELSIPFLEAQMLILYNKNLSLHGTSHFDIAEVHGYPVFSNNPKISPQYFATPQDCLLAIRAEQASMMYCDVFSGMSYLSSYENRSIVAIPLNTQTSFSFSISKKESSFLKPLLDRFLPTIVRNDLNESLTANRQKLYSSFKNFVYYYPFEIICVCFTVAFMMMVGYAAYMRIKNRQYMDSYDYRESYTTLANVFGEAAFNYDCVKDLLLLFGRNANRLAMPDRIEHFSAYLESPDKDISLTREQLERILHGEHQPSEYHLEVSCQMADGSWQHFELIFSLLMTNEAYERPVSLVGCLKNTEQEYQKVERLTKMGLYDKTSGLFNRFGIETELQKYLHRSPAVSEDILMIVDVDYFKRFNDTYGHQCGDDVLIYIANQMKGIFSGEVILSRWGGDEFFLYFIGGASRIEQIKKECLTLQEGLRHYRYEGSRFPVTLSMGGAVVGTHTLPETFEHADKTLYLVKEQGRSAVRISE